VYPFAPVDEDQSDSGAGSASGQLFLNRSTRSGLLIKGLPNAIRSASPSAIALSATSLVYPQLPMSGPRNTERIAQRHRFAELVEAECQAIEYV
jgi:hypothetical protein